MSEDKEFLEYAGTNVIKLQLLSLLTLSERALQRAVEYFALMSPAVTSEVTDLGEALSKALDTDKSALFRIPCSRWQDNKEKLHSLDIPGVLQPRIDISRLDITVLAGMLEHLHMFPLSRLPTDKENCCGRGCDHACPKCGKEKCDTKCCKAPHILNCDHECRVSGCPITKSGCDNLFLRYGIHVTHEMRKAAILISHEECEEVKAGDIEPLRDLFDSFHINVTRDTWGDILSTCCSVVMRMFKVLNTEVRRPSANTFKIVTDGEMSRIRDETRRISQCLGCDSLCSMYGDQIKRMLTNIARSESDLYPHIQHVLPIVSKIPTDNIHQERVAVGAQ